MQETIWMLGCFRDANMLRRKLWEPRNGAWCTRTKSNSGNLFDFQTVRLRCFSRGACVRLQNSRYFVRENTQVHMYIYIYTGLSKCALWMLTGNVERIAEWQDVGYSLVFLCWNVLKIRKTVCSYLCIIYRCRVTSC